MPDLANFLGSPPDFEKLRNAVNWPGATRAFRATSSDPIKAHQEKSGTWRVLVIVDSTREAAEQLKLSDHDRWTWGVDGYLALDISERTGLNVRVRTVSWDRWLSMRQVAGTAEHEFRRHGRWLIKPDRRHSISADGDEATCRYSVDLGHEQWPSKAAAARDFAAVRIIEPGADRIEHLTRWGMNTSDGGLDPQSLKNTMDSLAYAARCFMEGILVLNKVPYRPSAEPTLVQLFDLAPAGFDWETVSREDIELAQWWNRVHHQPTRTTIRRLGAATVGMMALAAREIRKNPNRAKRPLSWTLGHLTGGQERLRTVLALPRWSDPDWFHHPPDWAAVQRASRLLLPPGTVMWTPDGEATPMVVLITDPRRSDCDRLGDILEEATGTPVPVRTVALQTWADNITHPLAWEQEANTEGTWITRPDALPPPAAYEQVCADRAAAAAARLAYALQRVAWGLEPGPEETGLVLENSRDYWEALVERLRRCLTNTDRAFQAAIQTHKEIAETPNYQPETLPGPPGPTETPDGEPPLVAAVRASTREALHISEALIREMSRHAEQVGVSSDRTERSLDSISESADRIRSALSGYRWVYPDEKPPRGWDPYHLNRQTVLGWEQPASGKP